MLEIKTASLKITIKKIVSAVILVVILVVVICLAIFLERKTSSVGENKTNVSSGSITAKHYTNERLGFSLDYSAVLAVVQEQGDNVVFMEDQSGPWMMEVRVIATNAASTSDWLASQPKGKPDSAGYELISWANAGTVLVYKFEVTDHNGTKPVFSKSPEIIRVENNKLYTISYRDYIAADQTLSASSDLQDVASSLKIL